MGTEESAAEVLETLWSTRKTGLSPQQKLSIRSLLNLDSVPDITPVLASFRSVIRKFLDRDLNGDDIRALLPRELSFELQSVVVKLLQKYKTRWKEEGSRDELPWRLLSVSCQARASFPSSGLPLITYLQPVERTSHNNNRSLDLETSMHVDPDYPRMVPVTLDEADHSLIDLNLLPCLESISWTLENRNSAPGNRFAIISLKLRDCARRSPLRETEVKFCVSRDTLEIMLKSMSHLDEQFANSEKIAL